MYVVLSMYEHLHTHTHMHAHMCTHVISSLLFIFVFFAQEAVTNCRSYYCDCDLVVLPLKLSFLSLFLTAQLYPTQIPLNCYMCYLQRLWK